MKIYRRPVKHVPLDYSRKLLEVHPRPRALPVPLAFIRIFCTLQHLRCVCALVFRERARECVWRAYHPRPRALPSPPACILMFTLYGRAHCYWYIVNIRIHAGCVCSHYVSRRVCVRWIGERECVCVCLCACMCACLFVTQDSCLACPPGFYSNFLHATTAAVCVRVGWERKRERARARESVCVCICVTQDQMPCLFPWLLFEFSKKIIQLQ